MKTKVEIPETILRKHIASMKITNKLWDAIIKAMEEYSKENLREEYIQFLDWNKYSTSKRIVELINFDEYLKQKQ